MERILSQEGVPFVKLDGRPSADAWNAGRFVIADSVSAETASLSAFKRWLHPDQIVIDLADSRRELGREFGFDPFAAMLDARPAQGSWRIGGVEVRERIARRPHSAIRERLLDWLRQRVASDGGVWARLARFPHPYRSAFHFRADLDEHEPGDYFRFAAARRPLDDCVTHFVSTRAYGDDRRVMTSLSRLDCQSHGHSHCVYRDPDANRRNLERADRILRGWGIAPTGFAAPEGRWNPGLDRAIENVGGLYSSEFQIGWDDWPFFAWRSDDQRFSSVLQVPVHPICEGIFLEAGAADPQTIESHYVNVLDRKIQAGEAAFLYGHPERRLGRHPQIVEGLARAAAGRDGLWRVRMGDFAEWWRWRIARRWSVLDLGAGRFQVRADDWSERFPIALEVFQGRRIARTAWLQPRQEVALDRLSFEERPDLSAVPSPTIRPIPWRWRAAVRSWLDWETMTPIAELPAGSPRQWLRLQLRRWREIQGQAG